MIPVSIVTGFLGSGKTTLIGRLLRSPGFVDTAVIVNEWGEIGLDHHLIAAGNETLIALSGGCLCCRVRSDLTATLLDLERRRGLGEIPRYERVLIETSGLADPGPILGALITDRDVTRNHVIDTVLTLVDAQHGVATLERHAEARRQVALADCLLLTKSDVVGRQEALLSRLASLNPGAALLSAIKGDIAPDALFAGSDRASRAQRLSGAPGSGMSPFARADHSTGIQSFVLERERPIPALALAMWLSALGEHCGSRMLRLKGLVAVEEMPDCPAVVHAVQHAVAEPEWLERWPSADRATRIVFIAERIPRYFPIRFLEAIETEVRGASEVADLAPTSIS